MNNKLLLIAILSILLVGCSAKNIPPINTYTISPNWRDFNDPSPQQIKKTAILKLMPIRSNRSLASTEILYTDKQYNRNSYLYSRWNDTSTKLLQPFFHVSIEQSNLYKAVIPTTSVSKTDFILESTLLELNHQLNDDGTSDGIVRIRFHLIDNESRRLLTSNEFMAKVAVSDNNAKSAVSAINTAVTTIADALVLWLAKNHPVQ